MLLHSTNTLQDHQGNLAEIIAMVAGGSLVYSAQIHWEALSTAFSYCLVMNRVGLGGNVRLGYRCCAKAKELILSAL